MLIGLSRRRECAILTLSLFSSHESDVIDLRIVLLPDQLSREAFNTIEHYTAVRAEYLKPKLAEQLFLLQAVEG